MIIFLVFFSLSKQSACKLAVTAASYRQQGPNINMPTLAFHTFTDPTLSKMVAQAYSWWREHPTADPFSFNGDPHTHPRYTAEWNANKAVNSYLLRHIRRLSPVVQIDVISLVCLTDFRSCNCGTTDQCNTAVQGVPCRGGSRELIGCLSSSHTLTHMHVCARTHTQRGRESERESYNVYD